MSQLIGEVDFGDGVRRPLSFILNPEGLYDEEIMRKMLNDNILHVAPFKQFEIYDSLMTYSHVNFTPYSVYNTIVEVNIPHVLHIPSFTRLKLSTPIESIVFLQKIWTDNASESFDFDVISDIPLYYRGGEFESPEIPHTASNSWNWKIPRSKNVDEIISFGNLRYTKMYIHFNSNFTPKEAQLGEFNKDCLPEIKNNALDIVNKILSTYRNTMETYSVGLLNHVEIMDIYFPRWGFGYYPVKGNIGDAIINREKGKVNSFIEKLNNKEDIPTHDLLIDNAKSALITRDFKSVVIESFSATDLFVEYLINSLLIKTGKSMNDIGINDVKGVYWSTRFGLGEGYKYFFGETFRHENESLYKAWTIAHTKIRNKVVHNGYNPNESDANESLIVNEALLNAIKSKL